MTDQPVRPVRETAPVPEDLKARYEDLDCWLHSRDNEPPVRLGSKDEMKLIKRIAQADQRAAQQDKVITELEQQLNEAKAGWDSAIADLYAAAEIAKGMQSQLADERLAFDHANEVIGKLEADIAALSWTMNLLREGD